MIAARRITATAVLLAGVIALIVPSNHAPASAQTDGRLDLVAQTLFIDDTPPQIVLRVNGAPEDARLQFRIFRDPRLTRDAVKESHDNPPTVGSQIANFECTLTGDCFEQATFEISPSGLMTVTLLPELLGESLRRRPGALPFVVTLRDDDGNELDSIATSLVVLDGSPANSMHVAFVTDLAVDVAHRPDGTVSVDTESLLLQADSIASRARVPITVNVQPETLEGFASEDGGAAQGLFDVLAERDLLRTPWVTMDEEGWRAIGQAARVVEQYSRGTDAIEQFVGKSPTTIAAIDADANPDTLALLRSVGTTAVLVEDEHLDPAARERPATQALKILDANDVAMPALRYDRSLHDTLADEDAELGAYRALAELSIAAVAGDIDQGSLLHLEDLDPDTVDLFVSEIELRDELQLSAVTDLLDLSAEEADDQGEPIVLVSTTPPDLTRRAADLRSAATRANTLAAMLDPELDEIEQLNDLLMVAVADSLDARGADAYIDALQRAVDSFTSGFEFLEGDRITLTDRRTLLPLTIVNSQPYVLNVELILSAEKLRFPDGDRIEMALRPGNNVRHVLVETLASGDARVSAQLVAPGGTIELARGSVDIRSTALSGLGLVISIVALIVLGVWWIRTIVRVRHNRAAATVSAAADDAPSAPIEGES